MSGFRKPNLPYEVPANAVVVSPSNTTGILATGGSSLTTTAVVLSEIQCGGAGNVYVDYAGNNGLYSDAGAVQGAYASGTVTMSGTVNLDNDSVTINGTAVAFVAGATDTLSATACKNAINANSTVNQIVAATSALGVVTITMIVPGKFGNAVTTTASGTGVTANQATLAGGTGGSGNYVKHTVVAGQVLYGWFNKVYALGTTATQIVGRW